MQPLELGNALDLLRRRAEQHRLRMGAHPGAGYEHDTVDLLHLVQTLQTYQTELDIQHGELLAAQAEAEASRALYTGLYNSGPVAYCTLDHHGLLRRLNPATGQLLGRPAVQLLGQPLALYVEPLALPRLTQLLRLVRATPSQSHSTELPLRRADGQLLHVQVEAVAARHISLALQEAGCHLVLLDITARHRANATLTASEARFRATFEQSHDGMLLLENQQFVDANRAALHLLGFTQLEQLLGQSPYAFWPALQPDGRTAAEAFERALVEAEHRGWCRLELLRHSAAGEPVWDELSLNPLLLGGRALLHVVWRDITASQRIQQQLHQSEARLRQALDAASTGVWSLDLTHDAWQPDARAQEVYGLPAGVPFALLQAVLHPDDLPRIEQALALAARTRSPFDLEHRLLRPSGAVRYVAVTGSYDYDPATGQPRYLRGLVRDITDRRQAETERDYQNLLLQSVLRHVPIVFARLGPDGRFREYSGLPLRRMGLAQNELVGQLAAEVFPSSAEHFRRALAGEPVNYTAALAGQEATVHLQVHGFFDAERQEAILFGSDITEAEYLKEETTRLRLRQQQELHAVILTTQEEERRRIAESLHNGVGQLLYATRLHLDQLPPSEALHTGKELLAEAIRATRTVSFELTPPVLSEFGLPAALREMARRIPAGSLAVELDLRGLHAALPAPLQTTVYRTVQELLNNAIKHAQAREVFVSVSCEGDQLYVSVEDDGRGFEPGLPATGIGLASIRSRVELLGGTFEVRSRLGRGSNFFLQLPVRG